MIRKLLTAIVAVAWVFAAPEVQAQSDFYQGKTIRIIVGYSPGGGYDALARMLSRHMPKYIPGQSDDFGREHGWRRQSACCQSYFQSRQARRFDHGPFQRRFRL